MLKQVLIVPLFTFLGIVAVVAACKKSNSSDGSRTTLITKAAWKYDLSGVDLNKDGAIDLPDTTALPCEKDNTYLFKKDSTGVADEGATKCDPTDPQSSNFNWSLKSNQTILVLSGISLAGGVFTGGDVNISTMTDDKLVVYKDTVVSSLSFRYILSFKH